jgi:hypothetical protein
MVNGKMPTMALLGDFSYYGTGNVKIPSPGLKALQCCSSAADQEMIILLFRK